MTSRKRNNNKGKSQKAKAQAAAAERRPTWLAWARSCENREVECNHGCDMLPEPGSAVYRFIDSFEEEGMLGRNKLNSGEWMSNTVQQHPQVWADATLRKSAINAILRVGTNAILSGSSETVSRFVALKNAAV